MRRDWLWGVPILAALLAAGNILPIPKRAAPGDSFGDEGGGKRAFFLLASELLPDVRRSSSSLVPEDDDADTLVLLGPARYPDRAQWQSLHDWVASGKALVFAARWQDPSVRLEPFGIEVSPLVGQSGEAESSGVEAVVETEIVQADELEWRSLGQVRTSSESASVDLLYGGATQILRQPVGDGVIVVLASDFVFSNRSLTLGNNGLLAFRVLESVSPAGGIYFDEVLNEAGRPEVVGVLLEPPLRVPALQLVIVALLFGWMANRRFGPTETKELPARRSLVEHAEALGSLHFRVGTTAPLLASYLEFFRRELASSSSPEAIDRATRAAKSPKLDRARVASLLKSLARQRLKSSRAG
ncbi:MAG TPA: DUF4350 domain-containing protein [Vicinamibacteria bacterium]|nr:DUF4350 domain-containing protein [Vicinamibacteria bacterium]